MIYYSTYFFEAVPEESKINDPIWIKADNMLNDYQHETRDLREAIAWAKIVSLSCSCSIEVIQQEWNMNTGGKEWYCVATVNGINVKQ